ncbi:MAG: argH [Candidatus Saccharibacteria bacterium]|nr:argH [Candidatus Saccharibacteria bacterium]
MTNKLWQTAASVQLHPTIENYTVGDDHVLDQKLMGYDITASKAHAQMLESVGLLTMSEANELTDALDTLQKLWEKGEFKIQKHQEDGHTAIEQYLTEKLGDTGKKIHTVRSRNDQALVMMRLYLKDNLQKVGLQISQVATALEKAAIKSGKTPMPGYTHTQKAMPTTVATWLMAYADGFKDAKKLLDSTLEIIDQNPLGSAAGFGSSLPINKAHTTKTLGFSKTQDNPMYCGISRGLFELLAVQSLNSAMILSGKFAADLLMFTTQEFNFFSLPDSFTTGSSIMPHKHNYDVLEIMRGQAHMFGPLVQQLNAVVVGIGSGYHRDLQLTKKVTLEAFDTASSTLESWSLLSAI